MMKPTDTLAALPHRNCPICRRTRLDNLFRQRFALLEGAAFLHGYDVATCRGCGMGFADRIPEQQAFDAYYREASKYEYAHRDGRESSHDMARFQQIADYVVPRVASPDARILDIGCATGGLLSVLRDRGFADVTGVDPSPTCAEFAQRLYGIPVLTGSIADLPESNERFDFLILVGVLEHVCDLRSFLGTLRRFLNPLGRVFIEVPDVLQFCDCRNAPFQQFSVEHINYFSPHSLRNLMRVAGFEALDSQQGIRQLNFATKDPVVSAVYQHNSGEVPTITRDAETGPALRAYIQQSAEREQGGKQIIDRLVAVARPFMVWGVGTLTLRLLATSPLAQAPIVAFVDSNPKYQGKTLNGAPILSPRDLANRSEPVLISSWMFQREIENQIRQELRLTNELLFLYPAQE